MSLLQDLRFAVRLIVKDRWFTAVAVAALSLGIGVNATVFTLVNAVLIRGLPFKDSEQLYMLGPRRPQDTGTRSLSYADLQDWRRQSRSFAAIAAFSRGSVNIADDTGFPEQARSTWLTANAFQVLGQQPLVGRDFAADDERKGAERVAIIGHAIWKNRYGADGGILGRTLRINGEPTTIVGVMPEGLMFPTDSALWMPFIPNAAQEKRDNRPLEAFGRLRADATRAQAQAELETIARGLAAQYPDTNKELTTAAVQTFNERFNGGNIRQVFLAMMGAVGFVLLIACANVANLLLSRAAQRSREIALRIAVGASRWRVVRQLLVESVLLGFIGGAIGLVLALGGVRAFDIAVSGETGKPYWIQFTMDWVVLGFIAGICVLTGILFGLAPALQVTRTSVNDVLKEGGRGNSGGRRAQWMSSIMVVVEIALTIVLLVGAGLMTRSFLKLYSQDIGIKSAYLLTMRLQLPERKYPKPEMRQEFYDRLAPRLAAIPGAESVAISTNVPPQGGGRRDLEIDGRPVDAGATRPTTTSVIVGPTFFETIGAPLRRGRAFTAGDGAPGSEAVIVNQRFVAAFFPGEDPIGRRIRFPEREPRPGDPPPVWSTIVGIGPDIRHGSPQDAEPPAAVYLPLRQESPRFAVLLVRSRVEPAVIMNAVRREVQAIDQDQPVYSVQTVEQMLAQQQWPFRVFGTIFALLAAIALALAAVGLYAVMAYSVTQRTQEIGVRMALGAAGHQVSWLILRRGMIQLAIGLTIGLAGAWVAARVLRPLLVQIAPNDPGTFVAISTLLTIVALAACLIPARRATRLDPLVALRQE
ncbi:MAG TPA: ABC transporter permease [Vicinamibacterales bacterium]|nr:ABC transporter permease [Vicinamibacterales bacterium]